MLWYKGKKINELFYKGKEINKAWYKGELIFQKDTDPDKDKYFMRIWWTNDSGVITEELIDNITDFNKFRTDPVGNTSLTLLNGNSFRRDQVIDIDMGNSTEFPQALGNNFLNTFINLDPKYNFKFPDNVTSIGNRCLYNCYKFNVSIDFNNIVDIGNECLYMSSSSSFNSEIKMESIKNIGNNFMYSYGSSAIPFNSNILFGDNLLSIGSDFLKSCKFFNKPIILSSTLKSIGDSFLEGCSSFGNTVEIGNLLTSIGSRFLISTKFNSILSLPDTLTSIGSYFLSDTPYNKIIDMSSCINLSNISNRFLSNCETFNKQIIFPTLNPLTIGSDFCYHTKSLVQNIILPNNISSMGSAAFYRGLNASDGLTITCNMDPDDISTSGTTLAFGSFVNKTVVYIDGTYKNELAERFPNITSGNNQRNLVII